MFESTAYVVNHVAADGTRSGAWIFATIGDAKLYAKLRNDGADDATARAATDRRQAKREAANRSRRAMKEAMDSIGMKRTPYGWE